MGAVEVFVQSLQWKKGGRFVNCDLPDAKAWKWYGTATNREQRFCETVCSLVWPISDGWA